MSDLYALLAAAGGRAFGRRHLPRDRRASRRPTRSARSCCSEPARSGDDHVEGRFRAGARARRDRGDSTRLGDRRRTVTDDTGNIWLVRQVSQKTPDFGVLAIDLGSTAGGRRRHAPTRRRYAVRCRRHARAARRRARAQRSQDALGDRAAARSADRLGLARIAHAARLDPRRGDRAAANRPTVAENERPALARGRRARRGRAPQQRHPEPPGRDPDQPSADQAAARMDRAGRHRQFRAGAAPAAAGRAQGLARYGLESAIHLCRPCPDRAGVRAGRGQRSEILADRIDHHGGGQAQRP